MPRLLKSKLPFILLNVFSVVLASILIYSTYYMLTTYKTLLLYKEIKESYESSLYRAIETFSIYTKTKDTKDMVLSKKYLDNALNYIGTIGDFDDIYKSTDEESRLELLILIYSNILTEQKIKELIRYTDRIYRLYEGEEEFINMFQGNKALYEHTLNLRKDINGYVLKQTSGSKNVVFEKDKLKEIGITLSKIHAKVDVLDKSLEGLVMRSYKYLINSALVVLVFLILTPLILYILWRRRIEGSIISLYNYMLKSYEESKLSLNEVMQGQGRVLDMVDVEGVGGGANGQRKGIKRFIEAVYRNGSLEHKYNFHEVQDIFSNVLTKATSMSSAMKVLYGGKEKLRITFAVLFEKTNTLLKGVIVDTEDISLSLKKLNGSLISLDKSFIKVLDYTKKTYEGETRRVDSLYGAKRLAEGVYKSLASTLALVGDKLDRSHEFYKGASAVDKEIRDTVSIIKKVSDSAHVIYELINVINVIAEQTDLLAMNAAIEAAHAGEAGRGFGVVSEEIRKLAENTAKNSQEISRSLDEIIVDIKASEEITRDTGDVILNLFRNVKEVLESMFLMRDGMSKSLEDSKELIEILLSGRENIELGDRGKLDIKEQIESIEGGIREGIEMVERTKERVDGLVGNSNILLEVLSRGCDEVWVDFTRFER